jgi:DNA-binding response OmpR family regulator
MTREIKPVREYTVACVLRIFSTSPEEASNLAYEALLESRVHAKYLAAPGQLHVRFYQRQSRGAPALVDPTDVTRMVTSVPPVLNMGATSYDVDLRLVECGGSTIQLTSSEGFLLQTLMKKPLLKKEDVKLGFTPANLRNTICHLRKKLRSVNSDLFIKTVSSSGYKLIVGVTKC